MFKGIFHQALIYIFTHQFAIGLGEMANAVRTLEIGKLNNGHLPVTLDRRIPYFNGFGDRIKTFGIGFSG